MFERRIGKTARRGLHQFGPGERELLVEFDADDSVVIVFRAGFEAVHLQRFYDGGLFEAHIVGSRFGEGGDAFRGRNRQRGAKGFEVDFVGHIEEHELANGAPQNYLPAPSKYSTISRATSPMRSSVSAYTPVLSCVKNAIAMGPVLA